MLRHVPGLLISDLHRRLQWISGVDGGCDVMLVQKPPHRGKLQWISGVDGGCDLLSRHGSQWLSRVAVDLGSGWMLRLDSLLWRGFPPGWFQSQVDALERERSCRWMLRQRLVAPAAGLGPSQVVAADLGTGLGQWGVATNSSRSCVLPVRVAVDREWREVATTETGRLRPVWKLRQATCACGQHRRSVVRQLMHYPEVVGVDMPPHRG